MTSRYTIDELDAFALRDLISDAEAAERQSSDGPFFPEFGVTRERLVEYAARCRARATKYANGGAHLAVLYGKD